MAVHFKILEQHIVASHVEAVVVLRLRPECFIASMMIFATTKNMMMALYLAKVVSGVHGFDVLELDMMRP